MTAVTPTCSRCGYVFPDPKPPKSCPICGGTSHTFAMDHKDNVVSHTKLVAHKPPQDVPPQLPLGVNSSDSVSVGVGEGVLVHGLGPGSEGIRSSDSQGQSSAADLLVDGTANLNIQGRSRQGEEGAEDVCWTLIERLNQEGAHWREPKRSQDLGVDCEARDGEKVLKIQVTRAVPDQDVWKTLGRHGRTTKAYSTADDAADELRAAIETKADRLTKQLLPSQLKEITLGLDGTETLSSVLRSVVDSFRERHGAWACGVGFKEIWVIGPNAEFTFRLDDLRPRNQKDT